MTEINQRSGGTTDVVIPGIKYGKFQGDLIPACRSSDMLACLLSGQLLEGYYVALLDDIKDEDKCQRGPTGLPLPTFTPAVPFTTKAEWESLRRPRK